MENKLPHLVIYHANCADGFAAAFAAWCKLGADAEYMPLRYDQYPPSEEYVLGRHLHILEFSFPCDTMETLIKAAETVVWLDHHKTALAVADMLQAAYEAERDWVGKVTWRCDQDKCGAIQAWEHYAPASLHVPALFQYIDDYDRWQFKLDGTRELNKAIFSFRPWTFEQWRDWTMDPEVITLGALMGTGNALQRDHAARVESALQNQAMPCNINGDVGLMANAPANLASDLGHEMAVQSGTFGLTWQLQRDGKVAVSMRSNGDFDVSAICKTFGGGGHKNAAGCTVTIEQVLGWIGLASAAEDKPCMVPGKHSW